MYQCEKKVDCFDGRMRMAISGVECVSCTGRINDNVGFRSRTRDIRKHTSLLLQIDNENVTGHRPGNFA